MNKLGIVVINDKNEFEKRIKELSSTIKKYIDSESPEELLITEYLYYD